MLESAGRSMLLVFIYIIFILNCVIIWLASDQCIFYKNIYYMLQAMLFCVGLGNKDIGDTF